MNRRGAVLIALGLFATACSAVRPASDSGAGASAWVELVRCAP